MPLNPSCLKYSASPWTKCKRTTGSVCAGKNSKMHGAEERTAQDIFTGGCFMLKTHYQDDTTETFQEICRFPDSPTPASHCRCGKQAETCSGGCRKQRRLQPLSCIRLEQVKSTKECVMVTGGPWDQPREGELWGQFHIVQNHYINFQIRHKPKKLQQNMKTVLNWCCLSKWTETTLKYKKKPTVTNYTLTIILAMLMKEKSNIYGALHKLHTNRLPDEWHLKLCHYKQTQVVKAVWTSPGLADTGPQSLKLHRHYLLPDNSKETATRSVLSRTTPHFKRPHYCTLCAPLYSRAC